MAVRITHDSDRDEATVYLSCERQSYDEGFTEMVLIQDETGRESPTIRVQLGFEGNRRLL